MENSQKRLLIISNNVLSKTRNNGKTIYSYIDSIPKTNVGQLYFNGSLPSIAGYRYFQISDMDILKGILSPSRRGRSINCTEDIDKEELESQNVLINKRNNFTRLVRELIWAGRWKSSGLINWLDEFKPSAVFFVAGDSLFSYSVCKYVVKRFNAKLSVYVTDDYIMPRKNETLLAFARRKMVFKKMRNILTITDSFFTVSDTMQSTYKRVFNKDSNMIVNMTESLQRKEYYRESETIRIIYTGSLYYGRDDVIKKVASCVAELNNTNEKKAIIEVYTNSKPLDKEINELESSGCCFYRGSLNRDQLIVELNKSDILLFVESFDEDQKEKTRFSLSTKVPEYLSVGKPILAVGPAGIGSIEYLKDSSICINDINNIKGAIKELLTNDEERKKISLKALSKYDKYHNKEKNQMNFIKQVL